METPNLSSSEQSYIEPKPEYIDSINKIRKLPQNTDPEREFKRNEARRFRMDVMLDNAVIMDFAMKEIEKDINITMEGLVEKIKERSRYIDWSVSVAIFLSLLQRKIRRVKSFITEPDTPITAKDLFGAISGGKIPRGLVILDTSYPLAIILTIDSPEDFKLIDDRNNIGGFYNNDVKIKITFHKTPVTKDIPLIVVGPGDSFGIVRKHEIGHARNRVLMDTSKLDKRSFWLDFVKEKVNIYIEKIGEIILEKKLSSSYKITREEIIKAIGPLIQKILEKAKDEILADLYAKRNLSYIIHLTVKNGIYDYFEQYGIKFRSSGFKDPGGYIDEIIWNEYVRIILEQIEEAGWIIGIYTELHLERRLELFRYVLSQIPFHKWSEQIKKSGFHKEAVALDLLLKNRPAKDKFLEMIFEKISLQERSMLDLIAESISETELKPEIKKLLLKL